MKELQAGLIDKARGTLKEQGKTGFDPGFDPSLRIGEDGCLRVIRGVGVREISITI